MPPHFTPEALKFLRGLARHNDRAWFDPRKPTYERELKLPMLALIEEINHALATFAPDHIRPPHKIMLRIYRDTRFAQDKRPYKTHLAAWWARTGMEKTSGAGFYLHIGPTEVAIAAGIYMPSPDQLLAIRRYLLEHHAELRALLSAPRLNAVLHPIDGLRLTRPPRGFDPGSPAVAAALDLLLNRQWGVSATLPAGRATLPSLLKDITTRFALAAPLVHFLNAPLPQIARKSADLGQSVPNFGQNPKKPQKNLPISGKTH